MVGGAGSEGRCGIGEFGDQSVPLTADRIEDLRCAGAHPLRLGGSLLCLLAQRLRRLLDGTGCLEEDLRGIGYLHRLPRHRRDRGQHLTRLPEFPRLPQLAYLAQGTREDGYVGDSIDGSLLDTGRGEGSLILIGELRRRLPPLVRTDPLDTRHVTDPPGSQFSQSAQEVEHLLAPLHGVGRRRQHLTQGGNALLARLGEVTDGRTRCLPQIYIPIPLDDADIGLHAHGHGAYLRGITSG